MNHLLLPATIQKDRVSNQAETGDGGKIWMVAGLALAAALIAYAMVRIAA